MMGVVLPLDVILTLIYQKTRNAGIVMIVHFDITFPLFIASLIDEVD
jgi:membrane protease YdiL (CAAX protease family)